VDEQGERGHDSDCGEGESVIDLNSASGELLAALRGVTRRLADKLLAARPFTRLEDLLEVEGVSERLVEQLRKQGLTVTRPHVEEPETVAVALKARIRVEGKTPTVSTSRRTSSMRTPTLCARHRFSETAPKWRCPPASRDAWSPLSSPLSNPVAAFPSNDFWLGARPACEFRLMTCSKASTSA
jgi:hypothetical protein